MTLAEMLVDWTDWDVAAHEVGRCLGIVSGDFTGDSKHVVWTDNALGNGLYDALLALAGAGVFERRDQPDEQFRWRGPAGAGRVVIVSRFACNPVRA